MTRFRHSRFLALLTCYSLLGVLSAISEAEERTERELVWQDEFDGESLDWSKWGVEVNGFGGGNHEAQLYTERHENLRVENGHLVIEARRDHPNIMGTAREFSSARIRTKHRGDWKYGRIEVRAKLPQGQAIWPAIWMLPTDEVYGGWASSGEIDIMEMRGQTPDTVLGTLHYGGAWPNNDHSGGEYKLASGTFADKFHTFAVEWEEGQIRWYVDGVHYQTKTEWHSTEASYPAPFDQRFHLLLNVAVGGPQFTGPVTSETPDRAAMYVDFVRVYQ